MKLYLPFFIYKIRKTPYTQHFKYLGLVSIKKKKDSFYAHLGCICLIKNAEKNSNIVKYYYN